MHNVLYRIFCIIWYFCLMFIVGLVLIIPTAHHGLTGWFIGCGIIINALMMLMLFDCTINYIIRGKFELTPNHPT